jgi:biofilm protein TabA
MRNKSFGLLIATIIAGLVTFKAGAQLKAGTTPTLKQAQKWVKSRQWSNGCTLQVYKAVDAITFYQQYYANEAVWKKVFTYLREHQLENLAPGKYPIAGDSAYVSVTENPSKELGQAKWESHRNYIDLQYIIKGKEKIGVIPVPLATVSMPYDAAKDNANYITDAGIYYTAEPGTFYLFFPQDAHRPNIKIEGFNVVKKLVVKIKVAS